MIDGADHGVRAVHYVDQRLKIPGLAVQAVRVPDDHGVGLAGGQHVEEFGEGGALGPLADGGQVVVGLDGDDVPAEVAASFRQASSWRTTPSALPVGS